MHALNRLAIGFVVIILSIPVFAADDTNPPDYTYARDVAPILYEKCASCHRPGEIAPMSLLNYEEVRPWAKSIKKAVVQRDMPPWKADPAHGEWRNAITLTDHEIHLIASWVDRGAPMGDASKLPPAPEFTSDWQLGEPDYVIELPEVEVAAEGPDIFPNLDAKIDIPEPRWIRAVEVRPSDRLVTHHVVVFVGGFGGGNAALLPDFLAVWAVGTPPAVYPEGMGRMIRPNMGVRVNMHYHSNGTPSKDRTRIGLYFGEGELKKEITGQFAGTISFEIPPGAKDYKLSAKTVIDEDINLVSLFPHMHMRGKSMKYTATFPDGRSEVLLSVPDYDFNWQWFYYPEEPIRLPKGTRIDIDATYDNSADNPNNPDPTIPLTFGEESTDEMMFGAFEFIPAEGRSPKPLNPREKIQNALTAYPADAAYAVNTDLGMMKTTTGLVLPKEGDAIWIFPFGRQAMEVPLSNFKWDGNAFSGEISFFSRGSIKMSGTVKEADGTITGAFDMGGFGGVHGGGGHGGFAPRAFEGRRVAPLEAAGL